MLFECLSNTSIADHKRHLVNAIFLLGLDSQVIPLREHSPSLLKTPFTARYCTKHKEVLMQRDCYFCTILSKIGKLWQILIKSQNIRLRENSEVGSHAVPRGRTDGHDEASSRLSQLFENEKKLSYTFTVPKKRTKKEVTLQPHGALNLISPPQKQCK
jgi:hypothetical protein